MTDHQEQDRLDNLSQLLADLAVNAAGDEAFGVLGAACLLAFMSQGFSEVQAQQIILESAEENYARARARTGSSDRSKP